MKAAEAARREQCAITSAQKSHFMTDISIDWNALSNFSSTVWNVDFCLEGQRLCLSEGYSDCSQKSKNKVKMNTERGALASVTLVKLGGGGGKHPYGWIKIHSWLVTSVMGCKRKKTLKVLNKYALLLNAKHVVAPGFCPRGTSACRKVGNTRVKCKCYASVWLPNMPARPSSPSVLLQQSPLSGFGN